MSETAQGHPAGHDFYGWRHEDCVLRHIDWHYRYVEPVIEIKKKDFDDMCAAISCLLEHAESSLSEFPLWRSLERDIESAKAVLRRSSVAAPGLDAIARADSLV